MVCLYLWCGLKGYWVSCAVEAGSLGDYRWAGNRQCREYTEACLCPWPHFDQRPGPSCIRQAPRDQLALRGELRYSTARARIRVNNIRAVETRIFWLFTCSTVLNHKNITEWNGSVVSDWAVPCLVCRRFPNLFFFHHS